MGITPKNVLVFLAACLVMQTTADFFVSRDSARPGAEAFAVASPDVLALTGATGKVKTHKVVSYQGVPGKEEPYRQYQMSVFGSKGSADVTVRATETEKSWTYRLVDVGR